MRLLVLPGDGIGPEITGAATDVLRALDQRLDLRLELRTVEIGKATLASHGTTMLPEVLDAAKASDGVILGPISHLDYPPVAEGGINVSAALRIGLDLYANVRPSRSVPGVAPTRPQIDLVIVRENTEGFYADRNMTLGPGEFMPTPDVALSVRKVTSHASRRIARSAFEIARGRHRRVTAVHKANVLRVTDGLFLRCVREVAAEYADVAYDELLVDAAAALLIRDPARFDVIVTTNMFGDILSDEAAELAGSLGVGGSLNAGEHHALAQAQHGSAPDIAGLGVANPTSILSSTAMLLEWLAARHERDDVAVAARTIERALDAALGAPETRTRDLGGTLGTLDFTRVVTAHVERAEVASDADGVDRRSP